MSEPKGKWDAAILDLKSKFYCPFTSDACPISTHSFYAAAYVEGYKDLCVPCRLQNLAYTLIALKELEDEA